MQDLYDLSKDKRTGVPTPSFAVEGNIKLKAGEDGNYILALEPDSEAYFNWNNTKIHVVLTPEQVAKLTGLVL